jgi:hypothetical protein
VTAAGFFDHAPVDKQDVFNGGVFNAAQVTRASRVCAR